MVGRDLPSHQGTYLPESMVRDSPGHRGEITGIYGHLEGGDILVVMRVGSLAPAHSTGLMLKQWKRRRSHEYIRLYNVYIYIYKTQQQKSCAQRASLFHFNRPYELFRVPRKPSKLHFVFIILLNTKDINHKFIDDLYYKRHGSPIADSIGLLEIKILNKHALISIREVLSLADMSLIH